MAIVLDHQLREQIPRDNREFPITYFRDELAALPGRAGPLHWHPEFELATALSGTLDYQVGEEHLTLRAGDSIFVNGNLLHGIRQTDGEAAEPMPNVVFSGAVIASELSAIHQKYIRPILTCDSLPYVIFRGACPEHREVNHLIHEVYRAMEERGDCYEMTVQRSLGLVFAYLFQNLGSLPRSQASRIRITAQIRLRQMLSYIYEHYRESVTLEEIAGAANIGRSEAGRCFHTYMGCSPVEALIRHRLGVAEGLLRETALPLHEIAFECGFRSVGYFGRRFRRIYGCTPSEYRILGK